MVNLYSASGSPSDDGYLVSTDGQEELSQMTEQEQASFIDAYSWRVQNPNNFSQPSEKHIT